MGIEKAPSPACNTVVSCGLKQEQSSVELVFRFKRDDNELFQHGMNELDKFQLMSLKFHIDAFEKSDHLMCELVTDRDEVPESLCENKQARRYVKNRELYRISLDLIPTRVIGTGVNDPRYFTNADSIECADIVKQVVGSGYAELFVRLTTTFFEDRFQDLKRKMASESRTVPFAKYYSKRSHKPVYVINLLSIGIPLTFVKFTMEYGRFRTRSRGVRQEAPRHISKYDTVEIDPRVRTSERSWVCSQADTSYIELPNGSCFCRNAQCKNRGWLAHTIHCLRGLSFPRDNTSCDECRPVRQGCL